MSGPEELGNLNTSAWKELDDAADALEEAWKQGKPVDDLTQFITPGSPRRLAILHELIKTDLGCRWRHGHKDILEDYLDKFPEELGASQTLPAALVYEEYRVRHLQGGDRPRLQDYKTRFSDQFEELQRLVQQQHEPQSRRGRPSEQARPTPTPTPRTPTPLSPPQPSPNSADAATAKKPAADGPARLVGSRIGRYTLRAFIDGGTFGHVYKAEADDGIFWAMKIALDPIEREHARRDLEAMEFVKNLRHPFLLLVNEFFIWEGKLCISMELAEDNLRRYLNKCRSATSQGIPENELMKYMLQAAEAVDFMHAHNVLHRDIKPENILLSRGNVKVGDLGLAKAQDLRRAAGTIIGTQPYMPPEVWEENPEWHIHGDQFSLAAAYYELRTGNTRLFKINSAVESPKFQGLGEAEQKVLERALSKNPDERFPSCLDFVRALENALQPKRVPPPRPPRPWRRWAAVSAVAIVGFLVWWFWPRELDTLPAPVPAGYYRPVEGTKIVSAGGANKARKYYKHIECVLQDPKTKKELDTKPVRFLLIPRGNKPPFYIMEEKVTNRLFGQFAASDPDALACSCWTLGARLEMEAEAESFWTDERRVLFGSLATHPWSLNIHPLCVKLSYSFPHPGDLGSKHGELPVLRIEIREAHEFARWLGGLLPSVEEWDEAAGKFHKDRGDGPFVGPFVEGELDGLGVGLNKPVPIEGAHQARSLLGCKDMAGNGWEWTRTLEGHPDFLGLFPATDASAHLRGQDYGKRQPHLFAKSPPTFPIVDTWLNMRDEYLRSYPARIGFRVVVQPRED